MGPGTGPRDMRPRESITLGIWAWGPKVQGLYHYYTGNAIIALSQPPKEERLEYIA